MFWADFVNFLKVSLRKIITVIQITTETPRTPSFTEIRMLIARPIILLEISFVNSVNFSMFSVSPWFLTYNQL